jgi:hypothetical protein
MNETLESIQAAELDLDSDLARYPDLVFALEYWKSKCRGRFAPARADIDPAEIVALLPRILLADVEHDNAGSVDFRYRLSGTGICSVHQKDLTGLRPSELAPPPYGQLVIAHYHAAVERRAPLAHVIALQTNKESRSYARIILPLSSDGSVIDKLMMVDSETQNLLQEFLEVIAVIGKRR